MKLVSKIGFSLLACTLLAGSAGTGVQAASILTQENTITHSNRAAIQPIISKVSLIHYNVVRVELQTPISFIDNYINIAHYDGQRQTLIGATPVFDKNGTHYIGFDINLDMIARAGSNTAEVATSLVFTSLNRKEGSQGLFLITNIELEEYIVNAVDQGEMAENDFVNLNTLDLAPAYGQYLTGIFIGTKILNGKITTLTNSLYIRINKGFETGYTYKLTDSNEEEVQQVIVDPNNNQLIVNLGDSTFKHEQYTLSVQKNGETNSIVLMNFTPFNIF